MNELEQLESENVRKLQHLINIIHLRLGGLPGQRIFAQDLAFLWMKVSYHLANNPLGQNEKKREQVLRVVKEALANSDYIQPRSSHYDHEEITTLFLNMGVGR